MNANRDIDCKRFWAAMRPVTSTILPAMWPTCLWCRPMRARVTFTVSTFLLSRFEGKMLTATALIVGRAITGVQAFV